LGHLALILRPQALIQGSLTLYFWLEVVGFRDVIVHQFALEKHSAERARCDLLKEKKKFIKYIRKSFFKSFSSSRFAPIQFISVG
jgi:hypothetical protein